MSIGGSRQTFCPGLAWPGRRRRCPITNNAPAPASEVQVELFLDASLSDPTVLMQASSLCPPSPDSTGVVAFSSTGQLQQILHFPFYLSDALRHVHLTDSHASGRRGCTLLRLGRVSD
jgi:hypothetical protein